MNKIKIPKQFQLGGRTITVKSKKDLVDKFDLVGSAEYREDAIFLQKNSVSCYRTSDGIEEVYLHELTHWILQTMEERELARNEKFVNTFAVFLHQILKTSRYEK